MADAAGLDPDPHLALAGWVEAELLDRDRMARLLEDGGTHPQSVPDMTRPGAEPAPGLERGPAEG
jgi:hypothetical protein